MESARPEPRHDELQPESARLIVANAAHTVFQGPGGRETYSGTKHFSAGTRLHVANAFWGAAGESVQVVGLARHSRRLIHVTIAAQSMYNFRVCTVAQPAVLRKLHARSASYLTFPQSDENLLESAWGLSSYYWLKALRARLTAAVPELRESLIGRPWDRAESHFRNSYRERREQGVAEPEAAEAMALELIAKWDLETLTPTVRHRLEAACHLSDLWQM
ncbi:MAG: hypothetical protein AAF560_17000 [Acidobacteriota bacterium]